MRLLICVVTIGLSLAGCSSMPPSASGVFAATSGGPQPAGACTDYSINGWGDCNDFIAACGTGGNAHVQVSISLGSRRYTCHEGDGS